MGNKGRAICMMTTEISSLPTHLVVEVWILRVMQDCRTGCCGENWSSWLAIDALDETKIPIK